MKLLQIYTHFKKDMDYIEKQLEAAVRTDHAMLNQSSLHLLKAGGKRLRPVFVLMAGRFGNYDIERLKLVAVALELIHMATLVHDDVIDDAETRRGQLTVKSKWDNRIAMYTGDYILGKALNVITELDDPRIHTILSKAMVEMCIGEMEQIRYFYRHEQSVRDYLLRIRRKTALLVAISCQLGAIAAGAPESVCRTLYSFGYNVGMTFQIRDDVLDLTSTEDAIGKPPGSDLRQGNVTLPVIYALRDQQLRPDIIRVLDQIAEGGERAYAEVPGLIEKIRRSSGIKEAEHLSQKYIDKAIAALDDLPDHKSKEYMREIALFVGNRSY
ncbi:heptaprenyl diphosphate synthase component II [Paenibacillus turpanensis]|uniref:heptaprenyl diphosphate synthase component II n=1 Tax=Paenibacillus turpanensis TaxID=2689078 RepID=UPI0014083B2D|nr:heptaprenyl diphosphate synthase component II [Paenibacillus turpanensis]